MRRYLPLVGAILCAVSLAGSFGCSRCDVVAPVSSAVNMIYDDDCDGDIDCVTTQPVIHHWIDSGFVKMWGMVSSAPSNLGAPAMKVFQNYYNHSNLYFIGAWTPNCGLRSSAAWSIALVNRFDAGDACTNYPNCTEVLRQSIAGYIAGGGAANGMVYVITGPLSCEEDFRASLADSISPLTGAQMEQQYIKEFVLMNGSAPRGSEANCQENSSACSTFFANVTSENGYPPVYVVPRNTGATGVVTQIPASLPQTNPSGYAFDSTGAPPKTLDEDALAVEYGVFGATGWRLGADSTNTVDATSGANSWTRSTASGQYYLTTSNSPGCFENTLNVQWVSPSSAQSMPATGGESSVAADRANERRVSYAAIRRIAVSAFFPSEGLQPKGRNAESLPASWRCLFRSPPNRR